MTTYSAPKVCDLVGVTYRQLDYWCCTGLLRPGASSARPGSGNDRRFTETDLVVVAGVKRLLDAGVSLQRVRSVLPFLRDPEGCRWLYVDAAGGGVCATEELSRVAQECTGVLVLVDLERAA